MEKNLVGTATRYLSGRHAVQTVYWRRSPANGGLLKTTRTTVFKNENHDKINRPEMFSQVRERYA